jgi:hypothetical protein
MPGPAFPLLLLAAPLPPLPPSWELPAAEIGSILSSADLAIMRAELCAASRPDYAAILEPRRGRHRAVLQEAETLLGARVTPLVTTDFVTPCEADDRAGYLRDADAASLQAETVLRRHVATLQGLWLGPVRLCRGTVDSAAPSPVSDMGPEIVFRLASALGPAMRAETEARIGKPMGLYLDGLLIASPIVREALSASVQISLSGAGPGEAERVAAAALQPC